MMHSESLEQEAGLEPATSAPVRARRSATELLLLTNSKELLCEISAPTNSVLCLAPLNLRRHFPRPTEVEIRVVSCYALFK